MKVSAAAEVQLATGIGWWCAIEEDGRVACLQDGDPGRIERFAASAVAVSVGCSYACAIHEDRRVSCWELPDPPGWFQDDGQTSVPSGLGPAASIQSTCSRACAVLQDGSVACWGRTDVPPSDLGPVVAIAALDHSACAIRSSDATVACWGSEAPLRHRPPAGLGPVSSITTAEFRWCAIRQDGGRWCWDASGVDDRVLPDLGPLLSISATGSEVCGLDAGGTIGCDGSWGLREEEPGSTSLVLGIFGPCVVREDRSLRCWKYRAFR